MRIRPSWLIIGLGWFGPGALGAQVADSSRLSNDGVLRASAMVDSVFIDRQLTEGFIAPGDWASYLLARLGTGPIPEGLGLVVEIDTTHVEVKGRLQDLPSEARASLGPLAALVDSSTVIIADVLLQRTGPRVARFWLRRIRVNGIPLPEFALASMMAQIGRQYPALTASGRDLYVQVPPDGTVALAPGNIRLTAPPKAPTDSGRSGGTPAR